MATIEYDTETEQIYISIGQGDLSVDIAGAKQLIQQLQGVIAHEEAHAKRRREERVLNLLKDCEINEELQDAIYGKES